MDKDIKRLLGKLLGEVYRLQRRQECCAASKAEVFGLLNGFEDVIDETLERVGWISKEQVKAVEDVLQGIDQDRAKEKAFGGFSQIEPELKRRGVDRMTALTIMKFLLANSQFPDLIGRMGTGMAPSEAKLSLALTEDDC